MKQTLAVVGRFVGRDDAQDLVEYGLLAMLIAIFVLVAATALGSAINTVFWQRIAQTF